VHRSILALTALAVAATISGCGSSSSAETLIVTGSTTILPIAEIAGEQFTEKNEGVSVLVSGVGSSAGIEAVAAGTSQIGTSSRDLKEEEEGLGLVDTPIAYDGIAVIVNPDNPVGELTTEQLRGIFAGDIENWSEVGGEDLPIDLVNRDEASGTREAFKKIVMDKADATFDRSAAVLPGTGQVRDVVSRSRGAIGYISVGFVEPRFVAAREGARGRRRRSECGHRGGRILSDPTRAALLHGWRADGSGRRVHRLCAVARCPEWRGGRRRLHPHQRGRG